MAFVSFKGCTMVIVFTETGAYCNNDFMSWPLINNVECNASSIDFWNIEWNGIISLRFTDKDV